MLRPAPRLLPLFLLALPLPLASCLGPEAVATAGFSAAQAGVFEYRKGTMRTAWDMPAPIMFEAARRTLMDLEFRITREVTTGKEWSLRAMEPDYTAIDIDFVRASPVVTVVSIRVGTWGDQPVSKLIADRIDRHVARLTQARADEDAPGEQARPAPE